MKIGVPGYGMKLGDLDVAIHRKPITVIGLRPCAAVDTAIVDFEEIAIGVNRHIARIGMRRHPGGRVRVGDVRGLASWRQRGVDAEQPPRIGAGADGVGPTA
jgi:hypothetical protein